MTSIRNTDPSTLEHNPVSTRSRKSTKARFFSDTGAASVEQILLVVGMAALAAGVVAAIVSYVGTTAGDLDQIDVPTSVNIGG